MVNLLRVLVLVRRGGKAFIDTLLPRLNPRNSNGGPCMPFELEVCQVFFILYFISAET
jgi:magnesium transporter